MESVGYQIYPKSFFDSNDDGIGDLKGIIEKLDYLKHLGVNLIWICPFYDSPMDDNGYDVRNYFDVSPEFGTMDDVVTLISEAKRREIKIILDFVLNHTSDEHPWFIESRKSKDNLYRDYYIWHEGKIRDGVRAEPTNWGSFFGGSAWKYDGQTDSYYMKIFSDKMPDLNWKNIRVQDEMIRVARRWIELGVDGFRIDAVSHLARAAFDDAESNGEKYPLDWFKFSNLPDVHTYLKRLHDEVFADKDVLTIGEVGGSASIASGLNYAAFDSRELSMVFNFDHNWCNNLSSIEKKEQLVTNLDCLKKAFSGWQAAFKTRGWLPLNWLNHDQPRLMSQYGDLKYPLASGKMLATLLHLLRGTPFIYQGEEIGMTNYPFEDVSEFNDISSIATYYRELETEPDHPIRALRKASLRSRDNARTPMQWTPMINGGFSKGKPWLSVNPNYKKINVSKQLSDENSLLNHYRKLIELRRHSSYRELIIYGDYIDLNDQHPEIFMYERRLEGRLIRVINSFSRRILKFPFDDTRLRAILINNYPKLTIKSATMTLKPYQSVVIELKEIS